jgi:hypothetical protein
MQENLDLVSGSCTIGQIIEMVTTEASKAYITLHKIPTDFFLKPRSKPFPLTTSGALGREVEDQ